MHCKTVHSRSVRSIDSKPFRFQNQSKEKTSFITSIILILYSVCACSYVNAESKKCKPTKHSVYAISRQRDRAGPRTMSWAIATATVVACRQALPPRPHSSSSSSNMANGNSTSWHWTCRALAQRPRRHLKPTVARSVLVGQCISHVVADSTPASASCGRTLVCWNTSIVDCTASTIALRTKGSKRCGTVSKIRTYLRPRVACRTFCFTSPGPSTARSTSESSGRCYSTEVKRKPVDW